MAKGYVIAARLRHVRLTGRWARGKPRTQTNFAAFLGDGISVRSLQRYETGTPAPATVVALIAKRTHTRESWLRGDENGDEEEAAA